MCDRCECCTCTDCLNISNELYEFIGRDDVFWYCKDGKTVVNDILDIAKKHMKGLANLPLTQDTKKTSEKTHTTRQTEKETSVPETEQRTSVVDNKWIYDITTQAVNKYLVQQAGTTEANGTEEIPQTPTWATVAGGNNASQTKEIIANIRDVMIEQKGKQKQKEDR